MRALILAAVLVGCASPDSDARVLVRAPERASFAPVAAMLQLRCGSLDCHGRAPRNLRLYGYGGLRLAATDRPDGVATTEDELDASYRSINALEPERMTEAVTRRDPSVLTFYRKGVGIEHHKPGARLDADGERCVRGWIAGAPDEGACARSAALQR
jgi:hypothetical protein